MNKIIKKRGIKLFKSILFLRVAGYGALVIIALLIAVFFAFAFSNADKILYGITIAGEKLGHLPPQVAEQMLNQKISAWQTAKIKISVGNQTLEISPEEMGISIDVNKTIENAYKIGRNQKVISSVADQISSALFGKTIKLETKIDELKFNNFYNRQIGKIERKVQSASLKYNQSKGFFDLIKEQKGVAINKNKLLNDIAESALELDSDGVLVEVSEDIPQINEISALTAQKKANSILSRAPFILVYYNTSGNGNTITPKPQEYKLDKDGIKDMLTFNPKDNPSELIVGIDETQLKNFLIEISPSINQTPENAILTVKDGKVTEFALPKNGTELDLDGNISEIKNDILNGQSSIISLKSNAVLPEIRTDTIENLGLVALLAVGESDFKGSAASRAFNVALGAKKLNGVLIKPEEEFSFIKAIGDINQKEGYQVAYVIKGNKTVKEYGGGACQISTTMFRAAIKSGLKITERFPHSYPVQYYNPQGFDATVYGPHPDLRFINDTPSNILVQTKIKGTKLFFEFYGTPDGREVKVTAPVEYDKKPDGALKAKFTREIYKNGELISQETFKSNYQSPQKAPIQKNPLE